MADMKDWAGLDVAPTAQSLEQFHSGGAEFLGTFLIILFVLLFCALILTIWVSRQKDSLSPYTNQPMRRGYELPHESKKKVLLFLYNMFQYDNRIFEFKKAAYCRQTGRIFSNAITWYGKIYIDWSFLQRRYPGTYVSWGSLNQEQQKTVRFMHDSMDKYQTEVSSPVPNPSMIDPAYAFTKPGPLYVDVNTNTLLGWQCVLDSELEVLIVQKPVRSSS